MLSHVPRVLNDDFYLFISLCNFLLIYAFILTTCMTIVLDIVHPPPVVEAKSLKNWMLPPFSTGALPKGAKNSSKLSLHLIKETDPLLEAYQKRLRTVSKTLIMLIA